MISYFVMEVALESSIPTYSGGLGVLAGDTIQSFADLETPAVCVSILWKKGYVLQSLTTKGIQTDFDQTWNPAKYMKKLDLDIVIPIFDKDVYLNAWVYSVTGLTGKTVPVYFLDPDRKENPPEIRNLCSKLYVSEGKDRLIQEIILGIGGYELLKALNLPIKTYHINESHSALLIFGLLKDLKDINKVRQKVVFATHTPVPAAFDEFPMKDVKDALSRYLKDTNIEDIYGESDKLNLSWLAIKGAIVTTAVSKKHKYVSEEIFTGYKLHYVTNGVHHVRWTSPYLRRLFSSYIEGWELDPSLLREALILPEKKFIEAHKNAKEDLIDFVNSNTSASFDLDSFTIGIARRMTAYKRNNLILKDPDRLIEIASQIGQIQIVFAGKAHPFDSDGKMIIKDIFDKASYIKSKTDKVRIAFIENYDIYKAKLILSGSDIWLNTPKRPLEACGTSGMKASLNGIPNLSVLDGWWLEGCIEGKNGWAIGERKPWQDTTLEEDDTKTLDDIYNKLSYDILPLYYNNYGDYVKIMKMAIATVGTYFNSHRMVYEYITKLYIKTVDGEE